MRILRCFRVYSICISSAIVILTASCQNPDKNQENEIAYHVDEKIKQDAASIYFDSLQITNFLYQYSLSKYSSENLASFYKNRNYEFAWVNSWGINEHSRHLMNLLNNETLKNKNDSLLYHDKLQSLYNLISEDDYKLNGQDTLVIHLELLQTINFFDYAKRNWGGISDENIKIVSWFIERNNLNYKNLLETLLINDAESLSSYIPAYHHYGMLKNYLLKYYDIEKEGGWTTWTDNIKKLERGDTSSVVIAVKKQLYMLEDLTIADNTNLFGDNLYDAVKKFQRRNGLIEDGIIAGRTLLALRVPIHELIQKILINMERCKWIPVEQTGDNLVINIPDFKLHVYHDDILEWSCNVVVGKSKVANNTVIFNDNLESIVFSPYWNIPSEIIVQEILPAIKKNSNYLANHNMEVVNAGGQPIPKSSIEWEKYSNHFPYIIRQKPGKKNALGLVKFLFPNTYSIYIHDTPEKSLFNKTTRTFSHGCIRIQEPVKLASFLLRGDSSYTEEKIKALMNGGQQTYVMLKNKVPVFILYFTSWVDSDGKLNFRDDVYYHDEKMKIILFNN